VGRRWPGRCLVQPEEQVGGVLTKAFDFLACQAVSFRHQMTDQPKAVGHSQNTMSGKRKQKYHGTCKKVCMDTEDGMYKARQPFPTLVHCG